MCINLVNKLVVVGAYSVVKSAIAVKCVSKLLTIHQLTLSSIFEPGHEISNNVVCATIKASDQPAHTRSLIRAFACPLNILWLLGY